MSTLIKTIFSIFILNKINTHIVESNKRNDLIYKLKPNMNEIRNKELNEGAPRYSGRRDFRRIPRGKWKNAWRENWNNIKHMVRIYNETGPDLGGDRVNMVAARPWGVPCGDPNQHDMPWGTCTLSMECEGEFRIYRGDYFCGNTEFVCCGILLNTYDMYHGLVDASLSDTSLQTDSEELRVEPVIVPHGERADSKSKKRRREIRLRRARLIKRLIRNTVRDISKILNRTYRFGNRVKSKRARQMKEFIKELKRQYDKDRQSVKDIHEMGLHKIDTSVYQGIHEIRILNRDLVYNNSIHKWVVCGKLNKREWRMLRQRYPKIADNVLETDEVFNDTRRANLKGNFDYDIEFGLLYV